MIPALTIADKAREFIGTPWHHAARLKGVGIDCIGLCVEVIRELGVEVEDILNYSQGDEFDRLIENLSKYCDEVPLGDLWPGDCLVFRGRGILNHVGIFGGAGTFIHAYRAPSVGRVVEQPLDDKWLKFLVAVYRFRGATWQP